MEDLSIPLLLEKEYGDIAGILKEFCPPSFEKFSDSAVNFEKQLLQKIQGIVNTSEVRFFRFL